MKFSVQAGALTAVLAIAARSCGKSGDRNFVELCVEEKWPSRLTVRAVSLGSVSLTARMDLDAQGVAGTVAVRHENLLSWLQALPKAAAVSADNYDQLRVVAGTSSARFAVMADPVSSDLPFAALTTTVVTTAGALQQFVRETQHATGDSPAYPARSVPRFVISSAGISAVSTDANRMHHAGELRDGVEVSIPELVLDTIALLPPEAEVTVATDGERVRISTAEDRIVITTPQVGGTFAPWRKAMNVANQPHASATLSRVELENALRGLNAVTDEPPIIDIAADNDGLLLTLAEDQDSMVSVNATWGSTDRAPAARVNARFVSDVLRSSPGEQIVIKLPDKHESPIVFVAGELVALVQQIRRAAA